jgi:hypothetical protein
MLGTVVVVVVVAGSVVEVVVVLDDDVVEVVVVVVVVEGAGGKSDCSDGNVGSQEARSRSRPNRENGDDPPTAGTTSVTIRVAKEKTPTTTMTNRVEMRMPRVVRPGFMWRPRCRVLT